MSQTAELSYWALLHALPGMGPVTFRRLLDRFGSAEEAVEKADRDALAEVRGVRQELADALLACRSRLDSAERMVAALQKKGVHLLRMTDPAYPPALHDLTDPPPLLYILGQIGARDRRAVSMVGTTKPSARGRPIAEEFGKRFAAAGVTVVSGYAHGIDAASHRGAFRAGGRSILCVPYGIRRFKSRPDFPALAEIAQRGAVVSECPPDLAWSAAAAVARDRIIAALGRAVFVIETRPRGGTMYTVRAAEQLGRPLFVLKYRTPPESARGNSILIARGATDVNRFGEIGKILDGLGPDPRRGARSE
jgi:DNA processing protein